MLVYDIFESRIPLDFGSFTDAPQGTTIAIAATVVIIVAVLTATGIAVDAKMSSESLSTTPAATTARVV
jgi:hypothetical protein